MIGKLYKGLLPRKPQSTVYIKERLEKEGDIAIENEWLIGM